MRRTGQVLVGAVALVATALTAGTTAGASPARAARPTHFTLGSSRQLVTHTPSVRKALYAAFGNTKGVKAKQLNTTVPTTTYNINAGQNGSNYVFTTLGGNITANAGTTTVSTPIYPIVFTFQGTGDVYDPTSANAGCGERVSPITALLTGPELGTRPWYAGTTKVGYGSYNDAQMREEWWAYTHPGGASPNFHLNLADFDAGTLFISVSSSVSQEANPGTCANLGEIDLGAWDSYLQGTLLPSLSISTTQFPIFLVKNVVFTQNSGATCCILGYHSAYSRSGNTQTYTTTDYITDGEFGATSDLAIASHEINEWSNDPFVNNPTPSWGHTGQVSGCQGNLETGDPLTGHQFTIQPSQPGGIAYHLQELAFLGWFYDANLGVNGWYSTRDTFTTGAALCS